MSSRIDAFKPLLKYNGQSFVTSILRKLYPFCENVGIITGFKNEDVELEVKKIIKDSNFNANKIHIIHNPDFETGMLSSLHAGLKDLSNCDWLLYHFVDQPHIPSQFYIEFVKQIEDLYDWIQPRYNNKKGHPILLNKSLFSQILDSEINSLKDISQDRSAKKKFWNCIYPHIVEDIDTQEDYQKLI